MPSFIHELIWDDWNEEHIARYGVTPKEVEDICFGEPWVLRERPRQVRSVGSKGAGGATS